MKAKLRASWTLWLLLGAACGTGSSADDGALNRDPQRDRKPDQPDHVTIAKAEWSAFIQDAGMRFVPQESAGRLKGLTLYLAPHSSLEKMGLRSGQLVTAINDLHFAGQQYLDFQQLASAELERASRECKLSVTVKRAKMDRVLRASCL